MAKQLSAPEEKELKGVPYPKGFEAKFESMMYQMTNVMMQQFRNETLNKLNKGTVEKFDGTKFEDAQVGNYASVFVGLSKKAKRKLIARFSNQRLDREVKKLLQALNKTNQNTFYGSVESAVGISVNEMIAQEGLSSDMNALIIETQEWVKKLRDDNLAEFSNNALRVMSQNDSFTEVMNAYNETGEKRKNHARFIARNQLAAFNGLSNKIRYQKLGITEAVWESAKDERVRPSHNDRDGKTYDLAQGLHSSVDGKTLYPGTDYNCRCIARPIIPKFEG